MAATFTNKHPRNPKKRQQKAAAAAAEQAAYMVEQQDQQTGSRQKNQITDMAWLRGCLRSHKGAVSDADMSSNGQYLATSSEVDFGQQQQQQPGWLRHRKGPRSAVGPSDNMYASTVQFTDAAIAAMLLIPDNQIAASSPPPARRKQPRKQPHQQNQTQHQQHQQQRRHTLTSGGSRIFVPSASAAAAAAASNASNILTAARAMSAAASRQLALAGPPLKEYTKLSWSVDQLTAVLLAEYLLPAEQQFKWSYPTVDKAAGGVMVYTDVWKEAGGNEAALPVLPAVKAIKSTVPSSTSASSSGCSSASPSSPNTPKLSSSIKFDPNAPTFVPGRFHINTDDGLEQQKLRRNSADDSGLGSSGNASNSSSDSDSDSCRGEPTVATSTTSKPAASRQTEQCGRCRSAFSAAEAPSPAAPCRSHPGKPIRCERGWVYSCCQRATDATGCEQHRMHVWSGLRPGLNGPYAGFERTAQPEASGSPFHAILALDAEMVYTRNGLELAKVSICGPDGRLVYEKWVRPEAPVVDYNTRFSGITAAQLQARGVRTLVQVQQDVLRLVSARTILVGHAINNDLRCLRLLHERVVDTAVVFPHHRGAPFRLALKQLVKTHLQKDTQCGDEGHDSFEDARNSMAVLLWHVRRHHGAGAAGQQLQQ